MSNSVLNYTNNMASNLPPKIDNHHSSKNGIDSMIKVIII